jgi:hypothetical protein
MTILTVPASTLPNILQRVDEGGSYDTAGLRAVVVPLLWEFLDAVAMKYPHYTFTIQYGNAAFRAREIKVEHGAEALGTVSGLPEYDGGVPRYVLSSPSIKKERTRGTKDIRTKHLPIAVKAFHRYFHPQTPLQLLEGMVVSITHTIGKASRLKHSFSHSFERVCFAAKDSLMAQWDTIEAAAKAAGCPIQSLGIVEGQYQDYVVSHTLERLHDKGDGYYIGIKDGVYYMGDVGLKGASAFRSEELPAGVRGKIGMLKLVPDDTFVAGVGVRCSDTRFYIVPEGV